MDQENSRIPQEFLTILLLLKVPEFTCCPLFSYKNTLIMMRNSLYLNVNSKEGRMDNQLSFLRTDKNRREDPNKVRIFALTCNLEGFDAITETLETRIPNLKVLKGLSGTEGIKKVRSVNPDIILMDWNADDEACIDFLKSLKGDHETKRIPLIVFTKEPSGQDIRTNVLELGADAFLEGPVGGKEITAQVKTFLHIKKEKDVLDQEKIRLETLVSQNEERLQDRTRNLDKRVKELKCLYRISELRERPGISLEALLQGVADLIPTAWQRPETICARILLGYQVFITDHFQETPWKLARDIMVNSEWAGTLEVFYLEEPKRAKDLFPKEEASLITIIAERLGRIAERVRAEESLKFESENITKILKSMEDRV